VGVLQHPHPFFSFSRRDKKMKNNSDLDIQGLFFMVLFAAFIGGWIANIIKIVASPFDPVTGLEIARVVGVFMAPLGAVLGFL